jgi:thiamine pyrophosphokinase
MEPICYIVGAAPSEALPAPREGDFLIAADRGYASLRAAGLAPDLIMGDFDSLGFTPEGDYVLPHSPIKDDTDLLLAIRWAMERGWRRFVIYGALGGKRLDQTVASFQTLRFLADHGAKGRLVGDGWNVALLQNAALRFPSAASGWLSLFVSGEEARGVTLRGLKYELTDAALSCGMPLGVSNEFLGCEARIAVADGALFVLWQGEVLPEEEAL